MQEKKKKKKKQQHLLLGTWIIGTAQDTPVRHTEQTATNVYQNHSETYTGNNQILVWN